MPAKGQITFLFLPQCVIILTIENIYNNKVGTREHDLYVFVRFSVNLWLQELGLLHQKQVQKTLPPKTTHQQVLLA